MLSDGLLCAEEAPKAAPSLPKNGAKDPSAAAASSDSDDLRIVAEPSRAGDCEVAVENGAAAQGAEAKRARARPKACLLSSNLDLAVLISCSKAASSFLAQSTAFILDLVKRSVDLQIAEQVCLRAA